MIYIDCYKYQDNGITRVASKLFPATTYIVPFNESDKVARYLGQYFDRVQKTMSSRGQSPVETNYQELLEDRE